MNIDANVISDSVEIEVGDNTETVNIDLGQAAETVDLEVEDDVIVRTIRESLIPGGVKGDIIIKRSSADYDAEWVAPASSAEEDNTRPITAAAVYREIGNINALLATI